MERERRIRVRYRGNDGRGGVKVIRNETREIGHVDNRRHELTETHTRRDVKGREARDSRTDLKLS